MKKALIIPLLLSTCLLSAQDAIHSVSPTTYFNMQDSQQKQAKPAKHKPSHEQQVAIAQLPRVGQSEVMIINPETRAKDLQESFEYLKRMSPAAKLAVKLVNGSTIAEILDMKLMTGGTMIIFRTNSLQGQKFQVVKIEDIDTITNE